jgi:uncharacterized membrane protein YkvA (DUF1232 family)
MAHVLNLECYQERAMALLKRLGLVWATLRTDFSLLWAAIRHPACPRLIKVGAFALIAYLLFPIDFIPDVLPVVGAVDDLMVISFGVKWLVKQLPASLRAQLGR